MIQETIGFADNFNRNSIKIIMVPERQGKTLYKK